MAKKWYALRLQSGREEKIKENLEKRVRSQGLDELFGQMVIPTEKVQEIRNSKKRERERKIHAGYMYLEIEAQQTEDPDDRWRMDPRAYFIVKETPGVGDFIGERNKPIPMREDDVKKVLQIEEEKAVGEEPTIKIDLKKGDQVRIKSGPFENMEAVVDEVLPAKGMVRVTVTIFGRATPVELEYWQVGTVTA